MSCQEEKEKKNASTITFSPSDGRRKSSYLFFYLFFLCVPTDSRLSFVNVNEKFISHDFAAVK